MPSFTESLKTHIKKTTQMFEKRNPIEELSKLGELSKEEVETLSITVKTILDQRWWQRQKSYWGSLKLNELLLRELIERREGIDRK